MSTRREIRLTVNGAEHAVTVPPRKLLADCLRDDLGLTGTHVGCEQGVCGACTILLDGEPIRSCLMFAVQAQGAELETIESLARSADDLHPVQRAFWE
jgi:carbon-monoxide dehydrogenase small subunit